ncbi:ankyrin repeat-containing domain protein [Mycena rosella]|uniref:Ankyrin repeat-containing domain protein n=1 Tax=Mycena rosella TaxID=1033263 RepID=A0AAD7M979_MYCRO|nr:ankyrin repeat-containing domain protein [Mycena rosella]
MEDASASAFDAAAAYLSTSPSALNLSSAIKLELYGLFKFINLSSVPTAPRPSLFDFTGRAKWDAWSAAGNTYSAKSDAEARYLEIARSLGWTEGIVLPEAADPEAETEEDIWDSDDDGESAPKSSGEPGGFGSSVSSMARPEAEHDTSLHGLVVSNDLQGLVSLLQEEPSVDLNARDSFGYTPLHLAADRGYVSVVEFLLEQNADRTIKDEDEFTAVELAQAAGHERIVQLLNSPSG